MALTQAQLAAIKSHIDSSPDLSAYPTTSDGAFEIARLLNADSAPEFIVWRKSVTTAEVGNTVSYVAVEAMTDANRTRITTFYVMNPEVFEPRIDIRSFWSNTFSGALGGAGAATRDALDALWKRTASRAEQVLATGQGTTNSPADLGWEGPITYAEVQQARAS